MPSPPTPIRGGRAGVASCSAAASPCLFFSLSPSLGLRLLRSPNRARQHAAHCRLRARGEAATRALAGEGNAVSRGFSDSFLDCLPGSQGA